MLKNNLHGWHAVFFLLRIGCGYINQFTYVHMTLVLGKGRPIALCGHQYFQV